MLFFNSFYPYIERWNGCVFITVLLLCRDTLGKETYKREHLIGRLCLSSEAESRSAESVKQINKCGTGEAAENLCLSTLGGTGDGREEWPGFWTLKAVSNGTLSPTRRHFFFFILPEVSRQVSIILVYKPMGFNLTQTTT